MDSWIQDWQSDLVLAGCEQCDWLFLLPPANLPRYCPHCAQAELVTMDETADKPIYQHPPEQVLPFLFSHDQAQQKLDQFAKKRWLSPADLTPAQVNGRLQRIYLPLWLVDADVQARWQAEVGFNYEVVTHREAYKNNRWQTQEVKRIQKRWEPRVGQLQRHYANSPAPALEEQAQIEGRLGPLDMSKVQVYQPAVIADTLVRLPNRPPDDAWPDAEIIIRLAATEECRQAAAADHIRRHTWKPTYSGINWTQLLYPLYTTYYTDDDGRKQIIYLHGQTGRLVGRRRVSSKQALKWSLTMGAVAGVCGVLALIAFLVGFVLPDIIFLAGLFFLAGMGTAVFAFMPMLYAWYMNNHSDERFSLDLGAP